MRRDNGYPDLHCWGSQRQFWPRNKKTTVPYHSIVGERGAPPRAPPNTAGGGEAAKDSIGKNCVASDPAMHITRLSVPCCVGSDCGDAPLPPSTDTEWPPPLELILHRHSVSGSSSFHFRDSVINFQPQRNREAVCRPLAAPRPAAHSSLGFNLRAGGRRPQRTNTGHPDAIVPACLDSPPTFFLSGLSFTRSLHKVVKHAVYW